MSEIIETQRGICQTCTHEVPLWLAPDKRTLLTAAHGPDGTYGGEETAEDSARCSGTFKAPKTITIARKLPDGTLRVVATPSRRFVWYKPSTLVPALQWTPDTKMNRYEWERGRTPGEMAGFFEHVRRLYRTRPPALLPQDLARSLAAAVETGDNGLQMIAPRAFEEVVEKYEIHTTDPLGEWRFSIVAETWRGVLCDRLGICARDYRTLPDWDLLIKFRSWILDDDREAFIWLPDVSEGNLSRYENARPNALWMISPRRVQPDGTTLDTSTQSPS